MKTLQYKDKEGNWVPIPAISVNEWFGTQDEYDALGTYDDNTKYYILEE